MARAGAANPASVLGAAGRFSEVRQRLFFLVGALVVYRIGTFIPVPGIDPFALGQFFEQQSGTILSMFNMFSGGALERMSIFALGIMPYISASIIMQLAVHVVPTLGQLRKEGEAGRRKITQYTRYGTVLLCSFQSVAATSALQNQGVVLSPGIGFVFSASATLVTGTVFLMWLGEQITERGIGNGISMIILASIVSGLPAAIGGTLELVNTGGMNPALPFVMGLLLLAVTGFVVFMERAQRRITVNYAKRQQGRRLYAGQTSHLPFKINMSGVIPPIFASSLILFPATIATWFGTGQAVSWLQRLAASLAPGQPIYILLYAALIIFFCFFYTSLVFNSRDTADNLKRSGAFIPGDPSGPADRGLHRQGADPADVLGRHVHHRRLPDARVHDLPVQRAVLLRRHLAADHRRGDHGFHVAVAGAHDEPSIRRAVEEGQPSQRRPSIGLAGRRT